MTEISASLVKELREKTGAGMMDCKSALAAAGDMEGAVKILREKGLARAAKKTSRIAAEGLVAIAKHGKIASMIKLNCGTDFVARNDDFKMLAKDLAETALLFDAKTCSDECNIEGSLLNQYTMPRGGVVLQVITDNISTIGEKIELRRFSVMETVMFMALISTEQVLLGAWLKYSSTIKSSMITKRLCKLLVISPCILLQQPQALSVNQTFQKLDKK